MHVIAVVFLHCLFVGVFPCICMAVARQSTATFCFQLGHVLGDEHHLTCDGTHKLVQLLMNCRRFVVLIFVQPYNV